MKKIKDISILDYKKKEGYYFFNIEIEYNDFSTYKIDKRYSEIKELYKILILKCPGCLIPKFKSKSFIMKIKITELTKEEKLEIKSRTEKFLKYLINHPILIKNKTVSDFFSEKNIEINKNQALKTNKMKTIIENEENEDSDEDLNSSSTIDKISKSDNINIENNKLKMEKEFDGFEIIEKDKYTDFFEEEEENELINMYLEEEKNKNKGIVSKSKDFLISAYKYIKSYSEENNMEPENKPNDEMKLNLQEKDIEFIKTINNELGEDIEINNYGNDIMKIKEGLEYIINNFNQESKLIDSKIKSLDKVINFFQEVRNLDSKNNIKENINKKEEDNNKDKDNNDFENIEKSKDNNNIINRKVKINENMDKKILNEDINKIKNYSSLNKKYINKYLNPTLVKMNELKEIIDCLSDIFIRKKNHILFLIKLQSQLNAKLKKNELVIEGDESKIQLIKDINFFKKKIEKEKLFINKINQNLKYEIKKFKDEQENSIYILINDLYKNNYLMQCEIFEIFNKYIPTESDSENSSKIKGEKEKSDDDSDKFFDVEDDNEKDEVSNKNEDKGRKMSGDDF